MSPHHLVIAFRPRRRPAHSGIRIGPMPTEPQRLRDLSPQQLKSGLAAWLGWLFDGLDMHIFTLVAVTFVAILVNGDTFRSEFSTADKNGDGFLDASEWAVKELPADAPTAFIKKRWEKLVRTAQGLDRRNYELCVL